MDSSSLVVSKDQKGKPGVLVEVSKSEKQLWTWIRTKGVWHSDVQELYRKVCSIYEQIILKDLQLEEIQDVEYSLWKLHYRHIDEFRKSIRRSVNEETTQSSAQQQSASAADGDDCSYVKGFESFLSHATYVYRNLIVKTKRHYGLPEDFSFHATVENSTSSIEPEDMRMLKFLCHRFLVCLGDLARYKAQIDKTRSQDRNWSEAVAYYLEAIRVWPDSGNPQNQLAVLATYVGDEFLALYHCIRSLAVKEPFPDAWNNLILLFERNRSSHLHSLPMDAFFDFSKPFERSKPTTDAFSFESVEVDHESSSNSGLWPLIIRTISFFFLPSSLEDFSSTFAAMLAQLDALLALDEVKLKSALQSYQHMDSARNGPFRILQVVCIYIFVIKNLTCRTEAKYIAENHDQKLVWTSMAFASAFIFMGRLVERCLSSTLLERCPLLPAILVFVECLDDIIQRAEAFASDEKAESAMSYFFGALAKLLVQIDIDGAKSEVMPNAALWEDFELQGFASMSPSRTALEHSSPQGYANSFEIGSRQRLVRIVDAAMHIADRSSYSWKLFAYDKPTRKFSVIEKAKLPNSEGPELVSLASTSTEMKECLPQIGEEGKESDEVILDMMNRDAGKSVATDEEEIILFKPLTRYNSAPVLCSIASRQVPANDEDSQSLPADESLRRATSLLMAQNQARSARSDLHSEVTNLGGNEQFNQPCSLTGDQVAYAPPEPSKASSPPPFRPSINAGPPSLNAWVLDGDTMENGRGKGRSHSRKPSLAPIDEFFSGPIMDLSINETESAISSTPEPVRNAYFQPNYSGSAPSAPFLPDNADWCNSNGSTSLDLNSFGSPDRTNHHYSSPPQVNSFSNWKPLDYAIGIPGFIEGYQPVRPLLTSSEWLRQYREANKWPSPPYTPPAPGSFIYVENPALHTGVQPVAGGDGNRREMFFTGLQRPSHYGCSYVNEPEPMLYYLRKKEWLLQQDPAIRGPTYMGS